MKHIYVMRDGKIVGQPGQQQIKAVIVSSESETQAPNATLLQQVEKRRAAFGLEAVFGLRAAASDEFALGAGEALVFAGIAVEGVKKREVQKANDTGGRKIP